MMNITLSVDEQLLAKCREYAKKHQTSVNQLVRDYLATVSGEQDSAAVADEFKRLAKNRAGRSPRGFKFDREALYDRAPGAPDN